MITIGITGLLGAGKGTVVSYFEKFGFAHYSAREYLTEELNRRKVPVRRDTMTDLADELRKDHSSAYIIERLYEQARKGGRDCIIESIRALGEVDFLEKQSNFYLIAVEASIENCYARISKRKSDLDFVSFERFKADNAREMDSSDPTKGNIKGCMERADFTVTNDGTIEELYKKLDGVLKRIKGK